MQSISFHILRVGMAITFLWIGILIWQNPLGWSGLISPPLADLLLVSPIDIMRATAFLDIFVGALLLIDYLTWLAALMGSVHLVLVLIATGINTITIRDIGLLAGTIAIFLTSLQTTGFGRFLHFIKKIININK